ncbi:MAG: hypothetical protein RMX68_028845 [Aulosira sp. ZfuVER01]|nr:hypothetical protein [Aulosira sp. ZfuVER01]MDZ8002092.1 hypothetical protein [Aulosira sp. DedVER01a]MDZ8052641.1 hypothetical protein [Aulosira sp. ZfuCHP01]
MGVVLKEGAIDKSLVEYPELGLTQRDTLPLRGIQNSKFKIQNALVVGF